MRVREARSIYLRNFVFGVEDSLVSTVGLLSGLSASGVPRHTIVITGIVLLSVEALSMGVGSLLSEHSVEEFRKHGEVPQTQAIIGGFIMFASYVLSGFIPLAPYAATFIPYPFWFSIIITLLSLIFLGIISAKASRTSVGRHSIEMLLLGGIAIFVGVMVGQIVKL